MQEAAEQDFMACKQAYEVLIDAEKRRDYDATALRRRIGFFRDVVEEEEESARADPWEIHRLVLGAGT
jgi:DnaJ-class molecular chaperone